MLSFIQSLIYIYICRRRVNCPCNLHVRSEIHVFLDTFQQKYALCLFAILLSLAKRYNIEMYRWYIEPILAGKNWLHPPLCFFLYRAARRVIALSTPRIMPPYNWLWPMSTRKRVAWPTLTKCMQSAEQFVEWYVKLVLGIYLHVHSFIAWYFSNMKLLSHVTCYHYYRLKLFTLTYFLIFSLLFNIILQWIMSYFQYCNIFVLASIKLAWLIIWRNLVLILCLQGESDDCIVRLTKNDGLLSKNF